MKKAETQKTKTVKKASVKKTAKATAVSKKEMLQDEVEVKKTASAKSCPNCCSSCQDEMTDAFIQEVTEDVKNDNLINKTFLVFHFKVVRQLSIKKIRFFVKCGGV